MSTPPVFKQLRLNEPARPEPIRSQVRIAFSDAIRVIWMVMIGIGAAGLLISLFIRALPLGTVTDEDWGIVRKEDRRASSREV